MITNTILQADVLDILFENRNKKYGAYTLRKFYNNRLYKAMALTFSLAAFLCLLSFIKIKNKNKPQIYISKTTVFSPPPKDNKKPEKPKTNTKPIKATAKPISPSQTLLSNVKITNRSNIAPIKNFLDSIIISDKDIAGTPSDYTPVTLTQLPEGQTTNLVEPATVAAVDKTTPNETADVMPQYPGGMAALKKFLEKNLSNPEDIDEGQTVAVKVRFVVGYDGALKSFETVQDGGSAFNNEVIRVLKKMPKWIAGKTKGENVSVYYTIPVKFVTTE